MAVRTAIRRGLGKGLPCLVCVKKIKHARAGLVPGRHTLSFRLSPAGLAVP